MENDDLLAAERKLTVEIRAKCEALEQQLLSALRRLQGIIAATGRPFELEPKLKGRGERPRTSECIRDYLRSRSGPTSGYEIIRAVGTILAREYPQLFRPFGIVWKSLRYHDKHNGEVVCVTWVGDRLKRGKLQARPSKPRNIGVDQAEDYAEPLNLFWFRAEIKTYRRSSKKGVKRVPDADETDEDSALDGDEPPTATL